MMGWLLMGAFALLVGAGLYPFVRRDKGALQFLAAGLLLALAGYAWQGHPGFAGSPKAPPERQAVPESDYANLRGDMMGRFDQASSWLTIADSYQRRGDTAGSAEVLQRAVQLHPRDANLWVGYGNALVIHGGGLMSPAAELAFNRAAQIAPDHPGPRFFYGLALAQGGQFDQAEAIWRQLLADAPADAEYRRPIEERLQALQQARASGGMPPAPAPTPGAPPPTGPTSAAPTPTR
jgi:cytochrome c-type biogenesis protein CcmH/NrfG